MQFVLLSLLPLFFIPQISAQCLIPCPSDRPFCHKNHCHTSCGDWITGLDHLCLEKCPSGLQQKSWRNTTITGVDIIIKRCVAELCPDVKPYYYRSKCVDRCPTDSPFLSQDDQCLPNCTYGLKTFIDDNEAESQMSVKKCVYVCPDSKRYTYNGNCVDSCPTWAQYIGPGKECVRSCKVYKVINETVTGHNKRYEETVCVDKCPDDKPFTTDRTCLKSCPPDKPYYNELFAVLGSSCSDFCPLFKLNMNCTYDCPDGTRFVDGDNTCLKGDDCPPGTRFYDTQSLKKYGFVKCLIKCDGFREVFFKNKCISEDDCKYPQFVYEEVCVEECPSGFVYYTSPVCASQLALFVSGGIVSIATAVLLIYCRYNMYSIYRGYTLVWKILIRGVDIAAIDPCSNGCDDRDLDLDLDASVNVETVAEDEPIHNDRMMLV